MAKEREEGGLVAPGSPEQRCFVSELAISGRSAVCFAKLDSQGLVGESRNMQTRADSIYPATNKAASSVPSYTLGPMDHSALRRENMSTNFYCTPTLCQAALAPHTHTVITYF